MRITPGKVAAITGAGSGIGRALALALAQRGCPLALGDMDATSLASTAHQAEALGSPVAATVLDVSDRAAVFAWAADSKDALGGVNMLFNNAGVALSSYAESTQPADFEWLMGVNFWGVVHGTQAFLPLLRAGGEGQIVNISSVFGIIGMPTQAAYNASKFAVRGFTEALRMELELEGGQVGVTCVHPGGVGTNIAMSARIDPLVLQRMGLDAQTQRELTTKMLQVTTPESAAQQILQGVERNAARVLVGRDAKWIDFWTRLLGAGYMKGVLKDVRRRREEMRAGRSKPA